MIREYMHSIEGLPFVASLVLLLFFSIFMFVLWKTVRMTSEEVDQFSQLPLDLDKNNL